MSEKPVVVNFGPLDSEGFRSFSMHDKDGSEIIKVSLHIDRLIKTAPDFTKDEQEGLRTAAAIAAARDDSPLTDPHKTLAVILHPLLPTLIGQQLETLFPRLAWEAIEMVTNACIKFAISGVVEMNGAPRIYNKEAVGFLVSPLIETVTKEFLRLRAGRPAETWQRLLRTAEAVDKLQNVNGKEKVAETMNIDVSTLKSWHQNEALSLSWEEWLRASEMAGEIKNNFSSR
jgi:hypothetical protein